MQPLKGRAKITEVCDGHKKKEEEEQTVRGGKTATVSRTLHNPIISPSVGGNSGPGDPTHLRCSAADFNPKPRLLIDLRAGSDAACCSSPENSGHKAGTECLGVPLSGAAPPNGFPGFDSGSGRSKLTATLGRTGMMSSVCRCSRCSFLLLCLSRLYCSKQRWGAARRLYASAFLSK